MEVEPCLIRARGALCPCCQGVPQADPPAAQPGVLAARHCQTALLSCMKVPKRIQSSSVLEAQQDKLGLILVSQKRSGPPLLLPYPDTWEAA